jgi:hypothetical protein
MNRLLFILILSFTFCSAKAEELRVTISGYVRDSVSGEYLIGATLYLEEIQKGTHTNAYGFYSISIEPGNYNMLVTFAGYKPRTFPIQLKRDLELDIKLLPFVVEGAEVTIQADKFDNNTKDAQMGKIELEVDKMKALPALLGETDVLKVIQLLPGVKSAGEGNSGFYVRGGGPDQNLVLLDEAVVYNASHLLGFFSVFNPDAVKNVTLTKGGMPAQYGGRLASVLDISMKEGNSQKFKGSGGLGYIASRLTLEGPIVKDKASFMISGRRTFIDLFLREPFIDENSSFYGNSYYFYDVNCKLNYSLSRRDRLFFSSYLGKDVFNFRSPETGFNVQIPWGNATASLRWNHLFNDKLFMNTSLVFTDYKFDFGASQSSFDFKIFSGIRDYTFKTDFNYFPSVLHNIRFGAEYIYHRFTPTNVSVRSGDVVFDLGEVTRYYAHDAAIYINDEWDINDRWRVSMGVRSSLFSHVGPFTRYVQDPTFVGKFTDTLEYAKGEEIKTYMRTEPRLSVRFQLNAASSIKASVTQNFQYIHLASFGSVSLPTDIWMPSTDLIKPQEGIQYSTGYFRNFKNNEYETSVEVYYKQMKNMIEYREGSTPDQDVGNNPDNNFVFGEGESYGAEFFVKRVLGELTGWVGYTLSWTNRTFPDVNFGREYPAKYDRRHDISIVLTWEPKPKWTFGLTWVYSTGDALTLPLEKYFMSLSSPFSLSSNGTIEAGNNAGVFSSYGNRNDFRQDSYHRLDLSATLHFQKKRNWESDWVFSIYNVYSRMNPYFIYFNVDGNTQDGNVKIEARQVSLFGIIPSVTYNFRF